MVKGIIEKVESRYLYRVRIPVYHKVENTPGAVETEDLPTAPVCTLPGLDLIYRVGDVVWIGFENDEIGLPVILGILYRQDDVISTSDIHCDSIEVLSNAKLPIATTIGNVGNGIQTIPNLIDRVDTLQEQVETLSNT